MKGLSYIFFCISFSLLSGCVIPAELFFRNKTGSVVKLHGQIMDRRYFDRLPNKATFYHFPEKEKDIYGEWKETNFITWVDTSNFFIDVPAKTIINLEDITDKFSLGLSFPKVLLIATTSNRTDTISKGYYADPVTTNFKVKRRFLGTYTYYYDFE